MAARCGRTPAARPARSAHTGRERWRGPAYLPTRAAERPLPRRHHEDGRHRPVPTAALSRARPPTARCRDDEADLAARDHADRDRPGADGPLVDGEAGGELAGPPPRVRRRMPRGYVQPPAAKGFRVASASPAPAGVLLGAGLDGPFPSSDSRKATRDFQSCVHLSTLSRHSFTSVPA